MNYDGLDSKAHGSGPLSQRSAMSKGFYRKGQGEEKFGA